MVGRARRWSTAGITPAVLLGLVFCGLGSAPARATEVAYPRLAATTTITAHRTAGLTAYVPNDARLRGAVDHLIPSAVSITRRGGSYAFVGLSQPDMCRASRDADLKTCMVLQVYDLGALRGRPEFGDDFGLFTVSFDPPVLRKGRLDVYVVSDGDVTVRLNVSGLRGATTLPARRRIRAWMQRLPRQCPVGSCDTAGYGGVVHDVGRSGFVSSFATAVRRLGTGVTTPAGEGVDPGTQFATSCIYPRSGAQPVSPDPKDHPTGCDLHPLGNDGDWPDHVSSVAGSASPLGTGGGRAHFDYAASGRVYVGYFGGAVSTVTKDTEYVGYGVWVHDDAL